MRLGRHPLLVDQEEHVPAGRCEVGVAGDGGGSVPPVRWLIGASTSRWLLSNEWVVTPLRTRLTQRICAACAVVIVMSSPYPHSSGAASTVGRGPRNR